MTKPQRDKIVTVDFDGVLHQYITPWIDVGVIPDDPVPGALAFLKELVEHYRVRVFSTRNAEAEGRRAMRMWLYVHLARGLR